MSARGILWVLQAVRTITALQVAPKRRRGGLWSGGYEAGRESYCGSGIDEYCMTACSGDSSEACSGSNKGDGNPGYLRGRFKCDSSRTTASGPACDDTCQMFVTSSRTPATIQRQTTRLPGLDEHSAEGTNEITLSKEDTKTTLAGENVRQIGIRA
ncbi:hypothetical protein EDB85DRAFT_1893599 [Lactarius pseudohatsudake]|nr:hypothetical protein EDB85DRAFT_1893599 [Lactarius pseudohatsudake]